MIWLTCRACGFYMQFEASLLILNSFYYKYPICQTFINPDLKMRTPIHLMPLENQFK